MILPLGAGNGTRASNALGERSTLPATEHFSLTFILRVFLSACMRTGFTEMHDHVWVLYVGAGDSNSGPSAFRASDFAH